MRALGNVLQLAAGKCTVDSLGTSFSIARYIFVAPFALDCGNISQAVYPLIKSSFSTALPRVELATLQVTGIQLVDLHVWVQQVSATGVHFAAGECSQLSHRGYS